MFKRSSTGTLYQVCHLQLFILTMSAFPMSVLSHICIFLYPKSVTYFVSLMGDTSRPSRDESFLVDFISLSKKRLRNYLVPYSLHALMVGFFAFDNGFTSLILDREILSSVQLQLIYSHLLDCTGVPWGSLTSLMISLSLVNSFHQ
jgi:hypothetical protein